MLEQNTNDGEGYIFTCKECGCHDLQVARNYIITVEYYETLPCKCGALEDDIAAELSSFITTTYQESGFLDDDHHWEFDEREEIDHLSEEQDNHLVFCETCLTEADPEKDWECVEVGSEEDHENDEFYVYCGGCGREIEFGWSHPGHGGRIWPAECTDFNPWKCWPEPRYRDRWEEKNWLRSTS